MAPKQKKDAHKSAIAPYNSDDEFYFSHWLEQAVKAGLVADKWDFEPITFPLIPDSGEYNFDPYSIPRKGNGFRKLGTHSYTPDFRFSLTLPPNNGAEILKNIFVFQEDNGLCFVDVKSSAKFGKQASVSNRIFSIDQKLMMNVHGIYVNKIIVSELFQRTWAPESYYFTPIKKDVSERGKKCKLFADSEFNS